jgi:hypothetical protein
VADVADLEGREIAAAKLAVDAHVEERQLAYATFHLKAGLEVPRCL